MFRRSRSLGSRACREAGDSRLASTHQFHLPADRDQCPPVANNCGASSNGSESSGLGSDRAEPVGLSTCTLAMPKSRLISFSPQRRHGIDLRSPPRRQPAGGYGDDQQHDRHYGMCRRIVRTRFEEHALQKPCRAPRRAESDGDSCLPHNCARLPFPHATASLRPFRGRALLREPTRQAGQRAGGKQTWDQKIGFTSEAQSLR